MRKRSGRKAERYAAKLLFQFRVVVGAKANKRRLCEERIVLLRAMSARDALVRAKRNGIAAEHSYENSDGNPVHFEFVGVRELLRLGVESERDEVWWEMRERVTPMERRKDLIPPDDRLVASAG